MPMSARIRRSCFVPTLLASASRHVDRARSGLLETRTSGRGGTIDRVGAWGPAIFSDDTTSDIRADYREMLEDQAPADEATRRVIEAYGDLGADEEHLLWLALAAAQTQLGRLDAEVKARALDVIDSGRGLDVWEEAGARELTKRKAVLAKLRDQLTGAQPSRKAVRRPWRHETDLRPGDVLSFTASNGQIALLRVARIDDHRIGAARILELLDWSGRSMPALWRLRRFKARQGQHPGLGGPLRPETFRVGRHKQKDPDWRASGFSLAAQVPPRTGDDALQAWSYTDWRGIQADIERRLTS
jgi:hypothetical protein